MSGSNYIKFSGHQFITQRLVLSTLTGKPIKIDKIRSEDDNPGLQEHEAAFLHLLEQVTNGSSFDINYSGTSLIYKPGIISGGKINFDCGNSRAIGYFLEPLIVLAPFAKNPINITLHGITNDNMDTSVDLIRTVLLPQLKRFGIESGIELKIVKRGAPPNGGGEVKFNCPIVKQLKPVQYIDEGKIKRIRGIAYATRVSPQMANRVTEVARSQLTHYIPDVYIYTDVYKGTESGNSPGYGLSLVAETTTGALLSAECCFEKQTSNASNESEKPVIFNFETPEDLGKQALKYLLTEIRKGGSIDTLSQWINIILMVLTPEDVSKIRISKLTKVSIQLLRDIRSFFGITYKIKPDPDNQTVLLTCVGSGFTNTNKKFT